MILVRALLFRFTDFALPRADAVLGAEAVVVVVVGKVGAGGAVTMGLLPPNASAVVDVVEADTVVSFVN